MRDGRRVSPRPPGWDRIRKAVLQRDGHQCTWIEDGQRCPETTHLECDHIGDRDDHDPANLRTLCEYHHARRTAQQAVAARNQHPRKRPPRQHPGLL